ncbi:gamma-glutamylcyclotransferase [Poseidonocella sedimentorum]|uniref:Putative gamma-glutamylcyclotransferase n=1 Tax=Poseidonocella sedimentorum TaxID=871652 RepID=A0A1I6DI50_9RHOB|nr:gamma-glutamylcyclotransferase [Poseidonocella sedimentorum]SFR05113.1 nudix-type nucleoside diphosphatase, YffH/AdpP family [Poseidonocella sedimentorum]
MTNAVFLYGTLRHDPLRRIVLGRESALSPARLDGVALCPVAGGAYPVIRSAPGSVVEGALLVDASAEDLARLDFYESPFGYARAPCEVRLTGTVSGPDAEQVATVYLPDSEPETRPGVWSLEDWAEADGALTCDAATEFMGHFARPDAEPARMAALYPYFRARAWAQRLARALRPRRQQTPMGRADIDIAHRAPLYNGFFRLDGFTLSHRRFDGRWSTPIERECFIAYDAALVLPYDPVADLVLLVEQLRFGPVLRGDPAPWTLEPIAGLVDADEAPEDCARREALEEAGLRLDRLEPMMRAYSAPGYSTEFFHYFLALTDLSDHQAGLGGLAQEHEDIRSHLLSFDAAMALLDSGEINAGPLAAMLLWLARERGRLRAAG